MDISSGSGWPAAALSNFSPHPFTVRGEQCASMEGFLQSLKFSDPEMARHVRTLVGKAAKFKGKKKRWWRTCELHWLGEPFDRHGEFYQELLDDAFEALYTQNTKASRALLATGDATLTHSIGRRKASETVLTTSEFCGRLMRIRSQLRTGELNPVT